MLEVNVQEKIFNPLVSIIIPVYNGGNFMRQAIDSALAQTYKNIEVLVINDGSKDQGETEKIALSYGNRVRYFYKENGGVSSALNLGIKNMRGEYFSWLSHDDVYETRKIEEQIEILKKYNNPNLMVLCDSIQINKDSKFLKLEKRTKGLSTKDINEPVKVLNILFVNGTFNGCAFLIPKRVFCECGCFDETLRYRQDFLMWTKIFLKGYHLIYLPKVRVFSRVHNNQLTQTGRALFHSDSEKMALWVIPDLTTLGKVGGRLLYLYAKHNAKMNNKNVVVLCKKASKEHKLLSLRQKIILYIVSAYGKIRPWIRRIYYKIFKKVKTQ